MSFHLDPKWIAKSWTLWLNFLVFVASIVVELANIPTLGIDPKTVLIALTIANAILRLKTERPVTVRKPRKKGRLNGA